MFDVNVFGSWDLTRRVLPDMRARRSGSIVMVSSMSGRMALPGLGVYAASKFALEGMAEAWHHELRHFGIHVSLIEPGAYATDIWSRNRNMSRNAKAEGNPYLPYAEHMDQGFARLVDKLVGDAQIVADEIVDVLEGRRGMTLRIPMGRDAKFRLFVKRFAPERVVNGIVHRLTRI